MFVWNSTPNSHPLMQFKRQHPPWSGSRSCLFKASQWLLLIVSYFLSLCCIHPHQNWIQIELGVWNLRFGGILTLRIDLGLGIDVWCMSLRCWLSGNLGLNKPSACIPYDAVPLRCLETKKSLQVKDVDLDRRSPRSQESKSGWISGGATSMIGKGNSFQTIARTRVFTVSMCVWMFLISPWKPKSTRQQQCFNLFFSWIFFSLLYASSISPTLFIFNCSSGEVKGNRMSFDCQIDQRRKVWCFSFLERRVFEPKSRSNQPLQKLVASPIPIVTLPYEEGISVHPKKNKKSQSEASALRIWVELAEGNVFQFWVE